MKWDSLMKKRTKLSNKANEGFSGVSLARLWLL